MVKLAISPECLAPDCNEPHGGERPDMGEDFVPALDRDKGPVH
jgi:hypothetical protein